MRRNNAEQIPIDFQLYHKFALVFSLHFYCYCFFFEKNVCITINPLNTCVCIFEMVKRKNISSLCEILLKRKHNKNSFYYIQCSFLTLFFLSRYFSVVFRLLCFICFIYWNHCGLFCTTYVCE